MGPGENRHFFPLTSLQIGDMQSYLSRLTLFLAPESKKLFILVDNRPWLIDQDTRPAHLWQLMVTKSRLSPFANTTRAKKGRKDIKRKLDFSDIFKCEVKDRGDNVESTDDSRSNAIKIGRSRQWFALVDAVLYQKKALLPVKKLKDSFPLHKELHRTLYGFIVFEVAWNDVRGINYLNELQTDTLMALETKLMKRWEFDSIEQASKCIALWYLGTYYERFLLQEYLDNGSATGDTFYDAQQDVSEISADSASEHGSNENELHKDESSNDDNHDSVFCSGGMANDTSLAYTPPPVSGPYKRRKIMKSSCVRRGVDETEGTYTEFVNSPSHPILSSATHDTDNDNGALVLEATNHKDVLILFKFDDHDLPFKLKDIIMSDLRLLTLLEYGLPSWVIFLQSYPVFCQIYRPWMCPLARGLYVLISIITVLIGFYDLYKNVPLLKATASRLFGPLFDWIETWEMVSRIKYLGTMLFLHNFEKAIKWFLMTTRAIKSLLTVLTKPFAGPFVELLEVTLPLWNICLELVETMSSILSAAFGSFCGIVVWITEIVIWPFWFLLSIVWNIVWVLWEIVLAPLRLVFAMASFITRMSSHAYFALREIWSSISVVFRFASNSEARVGASEASMWRTLWNDLFSQVFRAVKSILYGFVAFFTTCNRHRLSIYNHIREFLLRLSYARRNASNLESLHGRQKLQNCRSENPLKCGGSSIDAMYSMESQEKLRRRRSRQDRDMGDGLSVR